MSRPWQEKEWLKKKAEDKSLTVSELASEYGVHTSTIYKWLGKHGISWEQLTEYELPGLSRGSQNYMRIRHNPTIDGEQHCHSVFLHRLIAVAEHGFGVVKGNDIHHKNGCRYDNRPENLEPVDSSNHTNEMNTDTFYRHKDLLRLAETAKNTEDVLEKIEKL
jgi:hypothetical protein